ALARHGAEIETMPAQEFRQRRINRDPGERPVVPVAALRSAVDDFDQLCNRPPAVTDHARGRALARGVYLSIDHQHAVIAARELLLDDGLWRILLGEPERLADFRRGSEVERDAF